MKNVAGYDLGKLVSGSFGTLAAIVDATFKLVPLPPASATLVADYADADALARDVAALDGQPARAGGVRRARRPHRRRLRRLLRDSRRVRLATRRRRSTDAQRRCLPA